MKRFIMMLILLVFSGISHAEITKVPLSYILPNGEDAKLRGQWDKISFPLTVLENQQAKDVKVTLSLAHSGNIDTASLWLHLGEKPLANIQLQPRTGSQQIVATLTPELLQRYGNTMTLSVRHQLPPSLSLNQQRIEASEAVTQLLTEQSFFEIDYQFTAKQPSLSGLTALIRSGQLHQEKIVLNNYLGENTDTALSVAGLLVQGWTLRSGTDAYQFHLHQAQANVQDVTLNGKVHLVYGLPEALVQSDILPGNLTAAINGPYLGFHFTPQTQQWILVVSGRSSKELIQAAQYFANANNHLPNQTYALINNHQEAEQTVLASNQQYAVETLTPQQQFGDTPFVIPFTLPANTLVNKDDTAHINLMLSHPKVAPGEAAMVLRVNGEYANSMPLRSSYWRDSQHYRLSFPMEKLHAGQNTISVELYGPEQFGEFEQGQSYQPFIAELASGSTLNLGAWVNYYSINEKQLHADQLLFAATDNGANTQLSLNFEGPSELTAVWQLLSHISLQARYPMDQLLITTSTTTKRPVQLVFNVGNTITPRSTHTPNTDGTIDQLRDHLLGYMVEPAPLVANQITAPRSQYASTWQPASGSQNLARLSTNAVGWRQVEFSAINEEGLNSDMAIYLSDRATHAQGDISIAVPNHESDIQLARAGFITHPYSLPAILFALLFPLIILAQRGLEARQ
ncbi:cellulose biosynthesis cyclic di-GMP-binding regulatory protein BcsB [Photobacterium minamisatsumaniensis]|uniref:cellulose biosynthesis cyclic di-GMP-binding regulatory protein BcsB n=1 Tax=Photobacterium minamisatsumaniensis TaxID=2910233 RepID=UPI003D1171AF